MACNHQQAHRRIRAHPPTLELFHTCITKWTAIFTKSSSSDVSQLFFIQPLLFVQCDSFTNNAFLPFAFLFLQAFLLKFLDICFIQHRFLNSFDGIEAMLSFRRLGIVCSKRLSFSNRSGDISANPNFFRLFEIVTSFSLINCGIAS
jgi:hypothetical protein